MAIQRIKAIIVEPRSLKRRDWRRTVARMNQPIEVDLPHKLGKEEARRRIAGNIHKLKDQIPGGTSHMNSQWNGDVLDLDLSAMGQTVAATIAVEETHVRCRVMLPPMLAMLARPIEAALNAKGKQLLLEDKGKGR